MDVFYHNLYELQKGLRSLSLCTLKVENINKTEERLQKEGVAYLIHEIGEGKINVYFGEKECIEIIKNFKKIYMNEYTPEQDFILGIMLGYDRLKQCKRYLTKIKIKNTLQFS